MAIFIKNSSLFEMMNIDIPIPFASFNAAPLKQ